MPDVELSKLQVGEIFFCMIEWDVSELSLPKSASVEPATRLSRIRVFLRRIFGQSIFNVSKRADITCAIDLVWRRVGISD
jgi:hypothetical protein